MDVPPNFNDSFLRGPRFTAWLKKVKDNIKELDNNKTIRRQLCIEFSIMFWQLNDRLPTEEEWRDIVERYSAAIHPTICKKKEWNRSTQRETLLIQSRVILNLVSEARETFTL